MTVPLRTTFQIPTGNDPTIVRRALQQIQEILNRPTTAVGTVASPGAVWPADADNTKVKFFTLVDPATGISYYVMGVKKT